MRAFAFAVGILVAASVGTAVQGEGELLMPPPRPAYDSPQSLQAQLEDLRYPDRPHLNVTSPKATLLQAQLDAAYLRANPPELPPDELPSLQPGSASAMSSMPLYPTEADALAAPVPRICTYLVGEACRILLVHGYANDPSDNDLSYWNDLNSFFETMPVFMFFPGGYARNPSYDAALKVDLLGSSCAAEVSAASNGPHSGWMSSGHVTGSGCDGTGHLAHSTGTRIEHLAMHLGYYIQSYNSVHGEVDVLAHSMGGLEMRYLIDKVERLQPGFPTWLLVEDIVTVATPHEGANFACWGYNVQLAQMCESSGLMNYLRENAQQPDLPSSVEWANFVSDCDELVEAYSGVGMLGHAQYIYPDYDPDQCFDHMGYLADPVVELEGGKVFLRLNPPAATADSQFHFYNDTSIGWRMYAELINKWV